LRKCNTRPEKTNSDALPLSIVARALQSMAKFPDKLPTDLRDYFEDGIASQERGKVSLLDREVATRVAADETRARLMVILGSLNAINEGRLRQNIATKIDEARHAIEAILFILDPDHQRWLRDAYVAVRRPLRAHEAINLIDPQRLFCRG
jgi:hypothetical protein